MTVFGKNLQAGRVTCWLALACLVVPMFGSYFFDDMFSTISYLFDNPASTALGWNSVDYGFYSSGYSVLCVFGGLIVCGILLDRFGVRVTGSIFVTMMLAGALMVLYAITSELESKVSLRLAYIGCMVFGLGSEISGTAVTRSIAKWFREGHMALAMGLQLSIARLGTAFALVISPKLVAQKSSLMYTRLETARPALLGVGLIVAGLILWAVFVAMDARFDRQKGESSSTADESERFRFSDVLQILSNGKFWLIALLCVFFYSSIIAFKKFSGAILIPRFGIQPSVAGWMTSMLPFSTVILAPLFGLLVDEKGHGTRWMLFGAFLALAAHLLLAFAPTGVPIYGYLAMVFLGFGYSLVPAALWPSLPKIVPEKVLGTAYALTTWVQNLGLMLFKMESGLILGASPATGQSGAVNVELMFVGLCLFAVLTAKLLARSSDRSPELGLDSPNK